MVARGTPHPSNVPLVGWHTISLRNRRCLGAALPPNGFDSLRSLLTNVPLVGWHTAPLGERRCLAAALPPDDGTPQAAIELGSIPFVIYSNKKSHPKVAFLLEQMTGIEPAYSAWEADVLPLNYICTYPRYYYSTAELPCQCETVDGFRLSDPREDGTLCPLSH